MSNNSSENNEPQTIHYHTTEMDEEIIQNFLIQSMTRLVEIMPPGTRSATGNVSFHSLANPLLSTHDLFSDPFSEDEVSENRNRKCQLCGNKGQIVSSDQTFDCPHCIDRTILRNRVEVPEIKPKFPCEICDEIETAIVFEGCKHLVGCENCVKIVEEIEGCYKCPKCNLVSENISKIFI